MKEETEKMLTDAVINLGVGMQNLEKEMKAMRLAQQGTNQRLDKLEKEQHKANIHLAEHSRAILKLVDGQDSLRSDFNKYAISNNALMKNHESRIVRLEEKPFGNSFVSEPRAEYKKRKKKK